MSTAFLIFSAMDHEGSRLEGMAQTLESAVGMATALLAQRVNDDIIWIVAIEPGVGHGARVASWRNEWSEIDHTQSWSRVF